MDQRAKMFAQGSTEVRVSAWDDVGVLDIDKWN